MKKDEKSRAGKRRAPVKKTSAGTDGTTPRKKAGADPKVRQYMVFGAEPGQEKSTASEFVLATCGAKAREVFSARHPGVEIWQVMQTAESVLTKSFVESHDQFSKEFQDAADEFRRKAYAELGQAGTDDPKLAGDAPGENSDEIEI